MAETAFDMVSPGPSVKRHRQNSSKKKQNHSQPVDIREGVSNALTLMREVRLLLLFNSLDYCLIFGVPIYRDIMSAIVPLCYKKE